MPLLLKVLFSTGFNQALNVLFFKKVHLPILDKSNMNRNDFNLLLLEVAVFWMREDATLLHAPHRDTLAGCAPIVQCLLGPCWFRLVALLRLPYIFFQKHIKTVQ